MGHDNRSGYGIPGFTHLGKRVSGMGRREALRTYALSVVLVAEEGDGTVFHTVSAVYRLLETLGRPGEVLLVDRVSPGPRIEQLLQEYAGLRVLIPTREISMIEGILLGAAESFAPHLLVLRADARILEIDAGRILGFFEDRRLFAVGFAGGKPAGAVNGAFAGGRVRLGFRASDGPQPAFLLPGFAGIYDREKLLKTGMAGIPVLSPWREGDFFYRCWARGWITMADSGSGIEFSFPLSEEGRGMRDRVRFFRGEIRFLHRNFRDRESRRLRRAFFFRYSLRRLLRFDPAPAAACLLERLRYLFRGRVRTPDEAVLGAAEIFTLLGRAEE